MIIEAIDALAGQRAALAAPEEQRDAIYMQTVSEPLRPLWQGWAHMAPGGGQGDLSTPEAGLALIHNFGFYMPEHGAAAGLQALEMLAQAGTWPASIAALRDGEAALRPAEHGVILERVIYSVVLANPNMRNFMKGNSGYTGFGSTPGQVLMMIWPTEYNMPRLPSAVAHEFNHNVRLSHEPWTPGTTVGQYIVLEGLAEAFAGELYGADKVGPWAQALTDEQVTTVRPRIGAALEVSGFNNIRGYIFGDWAAAQFGYEPQGLPDYAGYTIGYQVVRAYIERTGRAAAEATYVPWREIVEESGYF